MNEHDKDGITPSKPESTRHRPVLILPPNLRNLARLAGDGETARYAMAAVQLRATVRGYQATATDGRVLGTVSGRIEDTTATRFLSIPDLASAPNSATEALISTTDWRAGIDRIPGVKAAGHRYEARNLAAVLSADLVTFASAAGKGAGTWTTKPVEGRFPGWESVFPRSLRPLTVLISLPSVLSLLKIAEAGTSEDNKRCTLSVWDTTDASGKAGVALRIEGGNQASYSCQQDRMTYRADLGTVPDAPPLFSAVLIPGRFAELLDVASDFATPIKGTGKWAKLTACLNQNGDAHSPLMVETGNEAQTFRGLIMPLSA